MERIVLAYSGGLRSSAALLALTERSGVEVVTLTLDIGQGNDLESVPQQARGLGAVRAHVIDAREEFARDFLMPSLLADALADGRYPLVAALARPPIAAHLSAIASLERTDVVAHGGAADYLSRPAFDVLLHAIDPTLTVIAPAAGVDADASGALRSARARGVPVATVAGRPVSAHVNLWGRSIVSEHADAAWIAAAEQVHFKASPREAAPDVGALVDVAFLRGVPVAVNGVSMPLVELLSSLDTIAAVHAVGRLERADPAGRWREVIEAPAALVLHAARRALLPARARGEAHAVSSAERYANTIERGPWHSAARAAIDTMLAGIAAQLTGTVRLELLNGSCRVVDHHHDVAQSNDAGAGVASADAAVNGAWRRP